MSKDEQMYPQATRELAEQRNRLAPGPAEAFQAFSKSVFADGALPAKTKQLIAVAVAHVTQCPYCIRGHTTAALRHQAMAKEIMEASGWPRKCVREALTRIQLWLWIRSRTSSQKHRTKWALESPSNRRGRIGAGILKSVMDEPAFELAGKVPD